MKRWMRVAMLLCSVVISVATAHAVQQGDGKAMLERLAAKTKKEVRLLERAEKKIAAEADVDGSRKDKLRQRTGKNSELMLEQLAGGQIRPTRAAALGMGRLTGQKASCSEGIKNAEQDAGRIKEIRRELRQKKQLLRETEIKLARQNQADVSSKKARLRQKHPQSGQRVQSSQVVSAAEGETGSISGTVTDQDGNPVTGVYVFVYTSDYDYASYGWTDANGDYTVSGLASGSYKVEFDASAAGDYVSEWHSDKSSFDAADSVQVTAPNTVTVNASLAAGGSISGKVTDADGNPVAGVSVNVYTSAGYYDYAGDGWTDANGDYTVSGLASGSYKVEFDASDAGNYVSEWHSDKDSFATADSVQVTAPNTVTVNASLTAGGSISGKVTDADGSPLEDVYITVYTAYSVDCYYYVYTGSASTDADGNYTVGGLPSGSYKVEFDASGAGNYVSEWHSDKDSFETADSVQVTVPNTVTVNASLAAGGSISGKVTDAADGSLIEDVAVYVYTSDYNYAGYGWTDANGDYTVSGLASGSYKVEFDASDADAGNYASEWHSDKSSINSADLVQVTAPNDVTVNAGLAAGGSISGRVTNKDGSPVADVSVYVYTSDYDYAGYGWTDENGDYTVSGLASGSYKVNFDGSDAGNYVREWHSDKGSFDAADLVQVAAPNAATVNAELAAGGSISGKVTDEDGKPIIGSCWSYPYVTVQDSSTGKTIASAMVSSDGTYEIRGLPAGSYKVLFSASWLGYMPQWYNGKADFNNADIIEVGQSAAVKNIDAAMKIGGIIAGKVTDADGKPVAGMWVSASDSGVFGTKALASTDADGVYTLRGLPSGSYKVHFEADRTVYADEWYNNKRSFSAADSVTVTAPNVTADIDAALDPAPPSSSAIQTTIKTLLLRRK